MPRRSQAASILLVLVACTVQPSPAVDPVERIVALETEGCGLAADRSGTGIAIDGGTIVTVAHVVVQSSSIDATVGDTTYPAEVIGLDLERDLALLRYAGRDVTSVAMTDAATGAEGSIFTTNGPVAYTVEEPVSISIEEVLGTERHDRIGYRTIASVSSGDSGAGAYDLDRRLIGVVFAVSGTTTWLTSSLEIAEFVASVSPDATELVCDPERSRRPVG